VKAHLCICHSQQPLLLGRCLRAQHHRTNDKSWSTTGREGCVVTKNAKVLILKAIGKAIVSISPDSPWLAVESIAWRATGPSGYLKCSKNSLMGTQFCFRRTAVAVGVDWQMLASMYHTTAEAWTIESNLMGGKPRTLSAPSDLETNNRSAIFTSASVTPKRSSACVLSACFGVTPKCRIITSCVGSGDEGRMLFSGGLV